MHHEDFGGLRDDLRRTGAVFKRRDLLRLGMGFGVLQFLGCASDPTGSGNACAEAVPEETAGPFPGDGSNGPNVLNQTGVVRADIRSSFAGLSGVAGGIPLTVTLTLISEGSCDPLAGRAVYLWQCDREGRYSLYSAGVTNQNYLRGVQESSSSGIVQFTTVFPGCYQGRWPHIHFEVYSSVASATASGDPVATSQLALPENVCDDVYATAGYEASVANLQGLSLSTDNIFRDSVDLQLASVTGAVGAGYEARLTVAV